jgi:hypothetical protein
MLFNWSLQISGHAWAQFYGSHAAFGKLMIIGCVTKVFPRRRAAVEAGHLHLIVTQQQYLSTGNGFCRAEGIRAEGQELHWRPVCRVQRVAQRMPL